MTTKKTDESKGAYGVVYRELWLLQIMRDPLLAPRHFKVAFVLAIHMNTITGQTYPSRETVVRLAGVCKRTVDRALNWLESRGHLKRHSPYNAAKGKRSMRCWPILRVTNRSNIRDKLVHSLWTKLAQEPLTREPLKREPPILTAPIDMGVVQNISTGKEKEVDFRDSSDGKGQSSTESPPSLEAQCYAEARGIPDPERSAAIMAQALKIDGWDAAEALDVAREIRASGGDADELAQALWIPDSRNWPYQR